MANNDNMNLQADSPEAIRQFWLQQYATAFTNRDKRAAAVALKFAEQYNRRVLVAKPKQNQQQG